MAVLDVREINDGRSGGIDEGGNFYYKRAYWSLTDSDSVGPRGATDHGTFPLYGSLHPEDSRCFLTTYDIQPYAAMDHFRLWKVVVGYQSAPFFDGNTGTFMGDASPGTPTNPGQTGGGTAPNERPITLKTSHRHFDRPPGACDLDGVPVRNSAKQYFKDIRIPDSRPVYTFSTWTIRDPLVQSEKSSLFVGTINNDSWFWFTPYTCRCTEYNVETAFVYGGYYNKVDLSWEYKSDGWNPWKELDAGTAEAIDGDPYGKKPILDDKGNQITEAVPLDGTGHILAGGGSTCDDLVYLDFRFYQSADWDLIL